MKIELDIDNVTIVHTSGSDLIYMDTNLPDGNYPYKGKQTIKMFVAASSGEEYLKKHFPDIKYNIYNRS